MANKVEKTILTSSWITMIILLILFVPKNKLREAHVSFLFKQIITWLFGLLVVEKGLISYPFRLIFKKANHSSFTFEYFIYPALAVFFNLYFPEKRNNYIKVLYYLAHSGTITLFEMIALKYTQLIKYKQWSWYWSLISLWISYFITHSYYKWFFKYKKPEAV